LLSFIQAGGLQGLAKGNTTGCFHGFFNERNLVFAVRFYIKLFSSLSPSCISITAAAEVTAVDISTGVDVTDSFILIKNACSTSVLSFGSL
jgi:hypothetical protein